MNKKTEFYATGAIGPFQRFGRVINGLRLSHLHGFALELINDEQVPCRWAHSGVVQPPAHAPYEPCGVCGGRATMLLASTSIDGQGNEKFDALGESDT
jgi:hypothetical protein